MFFYLNSTINPIIYNVMSEKYRKAFHVTFCRNSIRYLLQKVFSRESDSTIANVCLSVTKNLSGLRYMVYQISDLSDLWSLKSVCYQNSFSYSPLLASSCILHIAYCISAPHTQPLRITNCHLSAITPISSLPHSQSLRTISIGHYAHQPSWPIMCLSAIWSEFETFKPFGLFTFGLELFFTRQSELSTRTNIDGSLISKSTIKNPNNPLEMSFMKNSPSPSSIRHPSSCPAVLQDSWDAYQYFPGSKHSTFNK